MDTNVAGLNKVVCFAPDSAYNGKTVEITDNTNSWYQVIDNLSCMFIIPSIPAPAKKTYTVILHQGDASTSSMYTRTFELGFGDSIRIGLHERYEPVISGFIPIGDTNWVGGFKLGDISTGIYADANGVLGLRTASSTYLGGVKVPNSNSYGTYMNGVELRTYYASSSQAGCLKIGEGLQINGNGIASIKPAGSTSSTKGGVYVESGGILSLYNDGKLKVSPPEDYLSMFDYYDGERTISAGYSSYLKFRNTNSSVISRFGKLVSVYLEEYYNYFVLSLIKISVMTNYVELYVKVSNISDSSRTWATTDNIGVHYFWFL